MSKGLLDILDLFDEQNRKLSVSDISKEIGKSNSTVYRYLRQLKEKNMIRDIEDGKFALGYRFLRYYRIVRMDTKLSNIADRYLEQLTRATGETTMLLVYYDLQAVCLSTFSSNEKVKVVSEPGEIVPLYAGGSSKALLAYLDECVVEKLYETGEVKKYTDKTIVQLNQMKEHLSEIREKGYAYSEGELYDGVIGYAVPIFDSDKNIVASLSVSGIDERMRKKDREMIIGELNKAAKQIEYYL